MGKPQTSLTGTVRDPAGKFGLYNVYVYVPNKAPDLILPGHPTCTSCQAPASGDPIVGAQTDYRGTFAITKTASSPWGVPAGSNIPLVLQIGKWRRQVVVPSVTACAANDLDTLVTPDLMRLPSKTSEGDMPLMALTTGCDPAECFLRSIGIDDSEFVPPTSKSGHVHVYTGQDDQTKASGSSIAGGNAFADTYSWWANSANLLAYDAVFNSCECKAYDRNSSGTGNAYNAIDAYVNGGGRLLSEHYFYNWFAPPTGTSDLQSVASWMPGGAGSSAPEDDTIDQSFPRGDAFSQWLDYNRISKSPGVASLVDTRDDVRALAGCADAGSCLSTQWIVHPGDTHPRYVSFNAPVGKAAGAQCGRAAFSDVHLAGVSNDAQFPAECSNPGIDVPAGHALNQNTLEFLFFDLFSCVQDDGAAAVHP
jgi:hypothetical protein